MARRFLYLVRHGQYGSTTTPPDEPDGGLTEIGKQQAIAIADRLRPLPIHRIHYSTAQRARETASLIATQFPKITPQPSALLRECIPCIPEAFQGHFAHIPADFVKQSQAQVEQAFGVYFVSARDTEADQHEILVSHGNLISHLICKVLKAPCESWIRTDIGLCGLSEVMIGAQGFMKVIRHNEMGHMPPHLQL